MNATPFTFGNTQVSGNGFRFVVDDIKFVWASESALFTRSTNISPIPAWCFHHWWDLLWWI